MDIRKLKHRLLIQQRATSQDSVGGQLETWTGVATVWAGIEPLNGRELLAAAAVQSELSHRITIRYRSDLSDPKTVAKMRGMYGTRIFNFSAAINTGENNVELVILASEGLNRG